MNPNPNPRTLDSAIDKPFSRLRDGLLGGLIAGWVFAVAEMIAAMGNGKTTILPWQMAATILRGQRELAANWNLHLWLTGAVVHFTLSALYGLLWAVIARQLWPRIRNDLGAHAALSMGYGLFLWLLNFQLLARVWFPWFLPTHPPTQMLLHMLAYGLPLGLYMEARLHVLIHGESQLGQRRIAH